MGRFLSSSDELPPLHAEHRRRSWGILGCFGAVLLAGLVLKSPLYPAGKAWRARGLAAQAEKLRGEKKLSEAVGKARVALALAPGEPAVVRCVARLSSLSGGESAASFWHQLLQMPAATAQDRRDASLYALATNQLPLAEEQIKALLQAAPEDSAALELAIQLALRQREPVAALAFADRLLAKSPAHSFARLNRAQVTLLTPDLAKATQSSSPLRNFEATLPSVAMLPRPTLEDARADVHVLVMEGERRVEAFRLLIAYARRREAREEALKLTSEMLAGPGWNFEDELLRLDLLSETQSPELEAAIQNLFPSAATKIEPMLLLGSWLLAHGRPEQLLAALPSCAKETQGVEVIKLLHADAFAALGRWSEVETLLKGGVWRQFETPRSAALARALREQGRKAEFRTVWRDMVQTKGQDRAGLMQLLQIAGRLSWADEQEELLWKMLERSVDEVWAPSMLANLYLQKGRTADLSRLSEALLIRQPQNALLKNNVANLSLLLAGQLDEATRLAKEAHEAEPSNPFFACTYAYALHRGRRNAEALDIMISLPGEALQQPNTAAYYAAILHNAGHTTQAAQYASVASRGSLLPEERELLRWSESSALKLQIQ